MHRFIRSLNHAVTHHPTIHQIIPFAQPSDNAGAVGNFVISPLLHSEVLADHDTALEVNRVCAVRAPEIMAYSRPFEEKHR
jgi:hypothetical protein